jgi:hypothetical protein
VRRIYKITRRVSEVIVELDGASEVREMWV